jgi:hypothetical protein
MPDVESPKLPFAESVEFERVDARITALERFYDQKFEASEKAVHLALQGNNERLDHMNKFRETLTDTTNRMITRVEALNVLEANAKKIDAEVDELRKRVEDGTRPNYPFIIGILSTAATLMTGLWLIVGLKIDNTVAPTEIRMAAMSTRIDAQAATSAGISDRLAELRVDTTQLKAGEIEIETQFCASDIVRNMLHADDLRNQSMLWRKAFGDSLPTDNAFYPQICNRPLNATNANK